MSYLTTAEHTQMLRMLRVFFALPYSTDLDGKDVEKIIRTVKRADGPVSKRKELFDIIQDGVGYSVKTLYKRPQAQVVDLQEQRFCDKAEMDEIRKRIYESPSHSATAQGEVLLSYMRRRVIEQMQERNIHTASSAILLKFWNPERTDFQMRYWEEDFLGYIDNLWRRHKAGELVWVEKPAGLHAQDPETGMRLLRMHSKHNQIFTDHEIPSDATKLDFQAQQRSWDTLYRDIYGD